MPPSMTTAGPAAPSQRGDRGVPPTSRRPRLLLVLVALLLLPMAVSAVVLVGVGDRFTPTSDIALIEMQVRDVGRHPVLSGLYSREDWSHPGPAQFLLMAPFYRLAGGSPVGTFLAAVAINAAAVAGLLVVAWRLGGAPMALVTALACSLLMRTLGADFLRDPWNCFVTVLPYGLALFLAWAVTSGDTWALPFAVGATSFVAQAHVGYVALAIPVLVLAGGWLVVQVLRHGDPERRRQLARAGAVAAGVGALMWLPPLADAALNSPSNPGNVARYFSEGEGERHTLASGWNILSAQLGPVPEWLTWHRQPTVFTGEPPALYDPPPPVLLVALAGAGGVLWRWRPTAAGRLAATLVVAMALGVVAISRIIGPAFDYRLRWTWILGMTTFVVIAWTAWRLLSEGRERAGPVLGSLAVVTVAVLSVVNVADAAQAGVPYEADSEVLSTLLPGVLASLEPVEGEVLVTDGLAGYWYARGLVSELERHGFDARVPEARRELFGDHRVVGEGAPAARVHVAVDHEVTAARQDPRLTPVAEWWAWPDDVADDVRRRLAQLDADLRTGRLGEEAYRAALGRISHQRHEGHGANAYAAAIFLDTDPSPA